MILLVLGGLAALVAGAELLVRGASRLAIALGLAPLVVGLTVVAYGTSAPEMAVSLGAALSEKGDLALGNAVGSNIFNVLAILGISALARPLLVGLSVIKRDVPVMIGSALLLWILALDGRLGRVDGVVLFALAVLYTWITVRFGSRASETSDARPPVPPGRLGVSLVLVLLGLALLVIGARWLVQGATDLAKTLGLSELIIGLTIVAAGTSLPEAATSIVATLRNQRDIAVGNIVGSNIFNVLAILGAAAIAAPRGIPVPEAAWNLDLPMAIAVAVACLPIFFSGGRISRPEGAFFLLCYVLYVGVLVRSHPLSPSGLVVALLLALVGLVPPIWFGVEKLRRRGATR